MSQQRDEILLSFCIYELGLQDHVNQNKIATVVNLFRSCEYEEELLKKLNAKQKYNPKTP